MSEELVYLTHAEIHNLANLEFFSTDLKQLNVICGSNEAGKTSFTLAIMLIFASGNDPRLLRNGKDKGSATVTFSDGYRATKTLFREDDGQIGYTLEVTTPEGGVQKAPVAFLKERLPQQAFDVDAFLSMNTDKQIEFLLALMPIKFSATAMNAALNMKIERTNVIAMTSAARRWLAERPDAVPEAPVVKEEIDLKRFDELYDHRYSQRKKLAALKRDVVGALKVMQGSLSNDDATDWTARRDGLQIELTAITTSISILQAEIKGEAEQKRSEKKAELQARRTELRSVIHDYLGKANIFAAAGKSFSESGSSDSLAGFLKTLDQVNAEVENFVESVQGIQKANIEEGAFVALVSQRENEALTADTAEMEQERAQLSEQLGTARAKADEQQRAAGIREAIKAHEENIRHLDYTEEDLSRSLLALEELRAKMLSALPIPGFSISWVKKNPVMTIDGVSFDRLNAQTKIYTVVRFFRLARPLCPLQILESSELDTVHFGELIEALGEVGCQVICPRWLPNCEHIEVLHSELDFMRRFQIENGKRLAELEARA